ncbi:MAG: radical SAM protein [Clostridia bacterium]|nr:radical SAM protein [Clostridia bacterium]MBR0027875.1 radical SAM protein [Clostridia bacterium]
MLNYYESCTLCPRKCGVNRAEKRGYCGESDILRGAKAYLHKWEEPCISGTNGSGTVFFTGCSLRCVYCQNREIALGNAGYEISAKRLGEIFLELQEKGAHNINLVTPTHFLKHIIEALDFTRGFLNIPIVYNCGGYENADTIKKLDGYVDVYLPDFKYMDSALAAKYSNAPDYPAAARAAVDEMVKQMMNRCTFDENGIMKRGVIVRHLVLPNHADNSKAVIKYLYDKYGDDIYMSIMNQFTPTAATENYPEINRPLTSAEYDEVVDYAADLGVTNAFVQEGGTVSESFIPIWNGEGILKRGKE